VVAEGDLVVVAYVRELKDAKNSARSYTTRGSTVAFQGGSGRTLGSRHARNLTSISTTVGTASRRSAL